MRRAWWICSGLVLLVASARCGFAADRASAGAPPREERRFDPEEWVDEADLPQTEATGLPVYLLGYDAARGVLRVRVPLGTLSSSVCLEPRDGEHRRGRRTCPGSFALRPGRGLVAHVAMNGTEAREWLRLRERVRRGSPAALQAIVTMHLTPRSRATEWRASCLRLTRLRIVSGRRELAELRAVDDLDW